MRVVPGVAVPGWPETQRRHFRFFCRPYAGLFFFLKWLLEVQSPYPHFRYQEEET